MLWLYHVGAVVSLAGRVSDYIAKLDYISQCRFLRAAPHFIKNELNLGFGR